MVSFHFFFVIARLCKYSFNQADKVEYDLNT